MSTTLLVSSRDYIDLDFLFSKHPSTNNVTIKRNVNSVKQSVLHLMQLKSGDKPFHPEIKSPIYEYLFENFTNVTQVVLESEIQKYLNTYEPRLEVLSVEISYPDPNTINCAITGTIINLMLPITINVLVNRIR
jgi:phage baseplate assembly protein W